MSCIDCLFFFNQLTTKSRDIPHRCQDWYFQSARLGNSYYLPFQFNVCLNLSPFSFHQFLYMKYTPRLKKFISSKLNFKYIYILKEDSLLSSTLLTFMETVVWPFRAGSLRSSVHTRVIKDSINLSILQVKTIFPWSPRKVWVKTSFWSLCYPRLRDGFNVHMHKHRKWTARLLLSAGCLLRANAQKNRANRGHSSKPNLPSFSICYKVLMSL